jgi:hypothetical protein
MVAEVYAGLSAFKAMFDMAKGLKDINDAAIRNGAVIELQEQILAAQEQQSTLIDRIHTLEEEVAHLKAWDGEKKRYELKDVYSGGAIVYSLKPEERDGEPPHWLCTNCYQQHQKSILQRAEHSGATWAFRCPRCHSAVHAAWEGPSASS